MFHGVIQWMYNLSEKVEVTTPISYASILSLTAIHKTWDKTCLAMAIRDQSKNNNKKAIYLVSSSENTESTSYWFGVFL